MLLDIVPTASTEGKDWTRRSPPGLAVREGTECPDLLSGISSKYSGPY